MRTVHQVLISVNREGISPKMTLCAKTDGVLSVDLKEILAGGKTCQFPPNGRFDLLNLFFHPLPSGAYAIGRLVPASESEQKNLARIRSFYLQYMIVDSETLLAFGNNPVLLYQEILSTGGLPFMSRGINLRPIVLNDVRKWFDVSLIEGMIAYPGGRALATTAQTLLHSLRSILAGGPPTIHVISALFNLFPVRFRPELTFSTGIYFGPERYFRLIGAARGNVRSAVIQNFYPSPYLNLDHLADQSETISPQKGWGRFIAEVLESKRFDYFQARLMEYDADLKNGTPNETLFVPSAEELDNLGDRWLEDLKQSDRKETKKVSSSEPNEKSKENKTPDFFEDRNQMGKIFHLKKRRDETNNLPLSISEKLRRWLLENNQDETVLYYRERKESEPAFNSDSDFSESDSSDRNFMPSLSSPPEHPRLGRDESLPRERLPYEEPLMIPLGRGRLFSPFQRLLANLPKRENELLELDSLVAHALQRDYQSGENLLHFWKRFKKGLDNEAEWNVREEYIHLIQIFLTVGEDEDGVQIPRKRLAALDVLDLFLNEGQPAEFSSGLD